MTSISKEIIAEKWKNLYVQEEQAKIITDEEINNIAIKIVKDIKIIVENIVLNDIKKVKENLGKYYSNYNDETEEKSYSLNLFNNPRLFYEELQKYNNSNIKRLFEYESQLTTVKNDFSNVFSIINFSIFTDLLIEILTNNKNAFNDNIIKSDISILIEVITSKVTRMTNSNSLFLCFVNELKEKYEIKKETGKSEFIKKVEELVKIKAPERLKNIKKELYTYIKDKSFKIKKEYQDDINKQYNNLLLKNNPDFTDLDKSLDKAKIFGEFYDEIKNNPEKYQDNLEELKKKCMEENVHYFFEYYAEKLKKKEEFNSCTKDYILNNLLLPFMINDIDINNEEDMKIIYNIPNNYGFVPVKKYYDTFLGFYFESKKELKYPQEKNYEKEICELINNDEFIREFFSIISTGTIKNYFESKIKFEKEYDVAFISDGDYDIFLKEQYQKFIKDFRNNYKKFRELIIIKQICYKIPAMTDSSMRIYINPVFEISGDLINDNQKINSVLRGTLLILLVHELAHFLKAYNTDESLKKDYPITPRNKESGRCLINYLFNASVIQSINYNQSLALLNISNWENLNIMRGIFKNSNDDTFNIAGQLDFYLTETDEDIQLDKKSEYCLCTVKTIIRTFNTD